jgi:hypothetical protein
MPPARLGHEPIVVSPLSGFGAGKSQIHFHWIPFQHSDNAGIILASFTRQSIHTKVIFSLTG